MSNYNYERVKHLDDEAKKELRKFRRQMDLANELKEYESQVNEKVSNFIEKYPFLRFVDHEEIMNIIHEYERQQHPNFKMKPDWANEDLDTLTARTI